MSMRAPDASYYPAKLAANASVQTSNRPKFAVAGTWRG